MDHRFNRNLKFGYWFSFAMLVIVGFLSYLFIRQLVASNRQVTHSNLIILQLEKSLSLMKDAETGQRGYLLTGREQFLEPYRGAYPQAMQLLNEITQFTRDNPRQQQNLAAIRAVMTTRMTIQQQLVDRRHAGAAISPSDLDAGKSAMDALRNAVGAAEQEEQRLLSERNQVLGSYAVWTPLLLIGAIIIALIIALVSYINVTRDIREKDRLRDELQLKEEETAAFNEELAAANEELTAINEELTTAREELAAANDSLEEKVTDRTKALLESEQETQALNEELTATNEELAAANEEYQATNEELSQTRGELEKSEHIFRSISENIPGSLVMVISREHRVIALAGDLLGQLHYEAKDHQGKHLSEVTSTERYEASRPLYERLLSGEQFRTDRKGENGQEYKVDFVPLYDDDRAVYAGLIIALDVTDFKLAQERSAKLAAIVESSDDAIVSKQLDGTVTSWNRAAVRLFGYTEAEMAGQSILRIIPDDRKEEEPQIIARIRMGERVEHFETKRLASDGRLIDVSLTVSPVLDTEGRIIGVSKIARDISEQKKDQQRKNDFIGMVSHELKTPLTSLSALIQVLDQKLRSNTDPFVPSALGKATVQVKKMSAMINGFLNLARLESGKILIEKQQFNLDELIKEVIDEARLTVSGHVLNFEPSGPLPVNADRDKIGSVLSNLLSNAVKYSPKGHLVTIRCAIAGENVQVAVQDEGMGIKPPDLEKLFDRYYRVETDHTRHISGFGIGLYLSAEIIALHEGRIWAESESGKGSTFYFTLPLKN